MDRKILETKRNEIIDFLVEKFKEFVKSINNKKSFKELVDKNYKVKKELNHPGVYVIFQNNEVLYVGSAGKGNHMLKDRIQDLFKRYKRNGKFKYYHTLTRKLVCEKESFEKVKRKIKEKFKILIIQTDKKDLAMTRALEYFFIALLSPKYNSETED